jgi:biotin-(acetyl-CoA carboxylase) ligase
VTSLEHELGRAVDAGLVLSEILVALNEQTSALESGSGQQVLSRWRALAPSATGTWVSWNEHGVRLRGVTAGVDQQGALLIRAGGDVRRIISGEVMWD